MDFDINNIDFTEIGNWPIGAKAITILVLCVITAGVWVYYDTTKQLQKLDTEQAKELQLKSTFESKHAKVINLDAYKKQLAEMKESFGAMLKQLPSKTEVAELLVDVSQTGLASGLEFELFKPEEERPVEFYAELPIMLRVKGDYHEFGTFVSGVAALPRIVTLHNFKISKDEKSGELTMDATAKTYRYLDETEQMEVSENNKSKSKQKKK
jgi:type IV pilus assembly protein PilO